MNRFFLLATLLAVWTSPVLAGLTSDIEFAKPSGVSLTLDAFVPEGDGPFPCAILVHGGGWTKGDKNTFITPLFKPLSESRFTWFSINYRLAPEHKYPACLEDVEAAIRWVRAHAKEYKVDPKRIALIGESAGGHLVSMAGIRSGGDTAVKVVVPFYGPHHLEKHAESKGKVPPHLMALLGISDELNEANRKALREASPFYALKKGLPPYLLLHGDKDETVAYAQSVDFQARTKELGNECDLITVPGGVHGITAWEKMNSTYAVELIGWLYKTMGYQ